MYSYNPADPGPLPFSIYPKTGRMGFFEVFYTPGKVGAQGAGVTSFCLEAAGFQAAKDAFDGLGLGEYRYAREITEDAFRDWQETFLAEKGVFL